MRTIRWRAGRCRRCVHVVPVSAADGAAGHACSRCAANQPLKDSQRPRTRIRPRLRRPMRPRPMTRKNSSCRLGSTAKKRGKLTVLLPQGPGDGHALPGREAATTRQGIRATLQAQAANQANGGPDAPDLRQPRSLRLELSPAARRGYTAPRAQAQRVLLPPPLGHSRRTPPPRADPPARAALAHDLSPTSTG